MPALPLSFGRASRRFARTVRLENENVFAEPSPVAQEKGLVLLGRPGLNPFTTLAKGPVRAYFCEPGVFDGAQFFPAGDTLYKVASNGVVSSAVGTVSGLDRVSIAGGLGADAESEIRLVNGTYCYLYDGTNITAEATPDSIGFSSIEYLRGCWFAVRTDTQEIYFRFISDVAWAALAFQSSEYKPDKAVAVKALGDQLVVYGEATTELFSFTGDTTYPLTPYGAGLVNEIGCRARDSVVSLRDSHFFVGEDCQVYRLSPQPQVISDPGLTEILRGAAANTLVAWGFVLDGHSFYVLNTEVGSFVYDAATQFWSKWSSYGQDYFRPWFGGNVGDVVYCADGVGTGDIWTLDPEALDDDGDPIVRRYCAFAELSEGRAEVANLTQSRATGWSPQTGQGSAPLVKARAYKDGEVPGAWREASLGALGEYGKQVRWNRWGQFKPPGILFEFEESDPVKTRVNSVRVNVP